MPQPDIVLCNHIAGSFEFRYVSGSGISPARTPTPNQYLLPSSLASPTACVYNCGLLQKASVQCSGPGTCTALTPADAQSIPLVSDITDLAMSLTCCSVGLSPCASPPRSREQNIEARVDCLALRLQALMRCCVEGPP